MWCSDKCGLFVFILCTIIGFVLTGFMIGFAIFLLQKLVSINI
jgi:hypothetical protein